MTTRTIDPRLWNALILDVDGVVTDTAALHAAAWKTMFDGFLAERAAHTGAGIEPFSEDDYRRHVDGRPRYDGVRTFLASRGMALPEGEPPDAPEQETICGLGNRKDRLFRERVARRGVHVFPGTVVLIHAARRQGMRAAAVSASRNMDAVLLAARLHDFFDAEVDGVEAARLGLPGKPAPDTFLEAARRLGVPASRAIVVEDAIAGVEAGRRGGFGLVVGVDRIGDGAALREHGADLIVRDLAELAIGDGLAA